MKHPNKSFLDNFIRSNLKSTYFYSKSFLEEKRKFKFDNFMQNSLEKDTEKNKFKNEDVLKLLGYNTLGHNPNKQKYLTEAKSLPENFPKQFSYNGLIYTFNTQLNGFVNHYGHFITIEQATAFDNANLISAEFDFLTSSASDSNRPITPSIIPPQPLVEETRDLISSFAWSYQYSSYGGNMTTSGGTTSNLFSSSGDLSNTSIWSFWSGAGYSRTTGFTAPNIPQNTEGLTSAWRLVSPNDANGKQLAQTRYLDYGNTYIFSIYIDLSNSPSASTMFRPSGWTQTGPTYGAGTYITIPAGATGWTRFEFTRYMTSTVRPTSIPLVSFPGGGPFTMVIWGPQLEKKS